MTGKRIQYIPSKSLWDRREFLQARSRQHAEAMTKTPEEHGYPPGFEVIVPPLPLDDEIICDGCNAEVTTPQLWLVRFGSYAVCDVCFRKYYEADEIEWRILNDDGSLGPIVDKRTGRPL